MSARRILYIQYTNPAGYPPLQHSSRILADAGWQVLFLGTGSHGASALLFPPHPNITVRQMAFCPAGWRQKLHYLRYAIWVLFWSFRWRPQWIYASDPLVCPVGLVLSFLPGTRVIYHEHDSPVPARGVFTRLCLASRRWLAKRAEYLILPNEARMARFIEETRASPDQSVCVWNCPSLQEVHLNATDRNRSDLRLYYHGNLSPSLLPPTLLHAVAELQGAVRLTIVGYETVGSRDYMGMLRSQASRTKADQWLEIHSAMPRHRLWDLLEQCDVGLALFPHKTGNINLDHLVGASNKVFDYLACGLALLVSDLPEWRDTYVSPGYARACNPDDPASIATALRWFLDHPDETRAMGRRGRQRIVDGWNYESQFGPLLALLDG